MKVVLAEKPSVGRSIANVIGATSPKDGYMEGNGYQVTWAYGHLVKLADPDEYISSDKTWKSEDLPILPNNFKYIPDTGEAAKRKQFNCIKKLFADADEIICATDAGREGEAIFRYIYDACRCTKPIKRLWISSLTDSAITKGFNSLQDGDEFLNLYASAMARAEADWLIGMNATRALTIASKSKNAISVGRVQSPTLAMICSRFIENQNFKPTPYYVVRLNLCEKGYTKQSFWANFAKKFNTKEDATKILQNISNEISVSDVQMTTVTERAPLPFDLTSIQAEANKRFKFKAQKTLDIIQKLYEEKLVTYPRTGSRYLGTDMINEISSNLPKLINNSHVNISDAVKFIEKNGMNKTPFNDKKLTDHHAIIPTFEPLTKISDDEMKIYQMISDQLVMSLMPDCIKRKITYSFGNEEPVFTASGTQIEKIGWRDFPGKRQEKNEDEEDNQSVPELKKGNTCSVLDKVVSEKMTVRPPLLTEATLLKKMETAGKEIEDEQLSKAIKDCGLGTPATRAAVIETLYKREYITNDKNHLLPTDKGLKVYEIISQYPIADVETTGSWEFDLNKIADGELQKEDFDNKIKSYAKEITSSLLNVNITITSTKQSVGICPVCGKEVLEGKNSYYCSGINKDDENSCKFGFGKEIASKTISLANAKALLSEKKTGLIKGFKSNAGKSFDAMLVLDENNKVNFQFEAHEKIAVGICPVCGKEVFEGKNSYYCSGINKDDENSCKFGFGKEIASKTISLANAKALLSEKKTGLIKGFKSNAGKVFDAMLVLDENNKVNFQFEAHEKIAVGICPVCGKEVFEGKNSYYCSGINKDDENSCKFGFGKEIASKTISLANAKTLLSEKKTGLIKGFKSNAGKSFDAMLVLDENNKVNFQFEAHEKIAVGICPVCGKEVFEGKNSYYCSGINKDDENSCKFGFGKEIASKTISLANAKALLSEKKTGLIKGFKSNAGKSFDAMLVLDENNKVNFQFENKKK